MKNLNFAYFVKEDLIIKTINSFPIEIFSNKLTAEKNLTPFLKQNKDGIFISKCKFFNIVKKFIGKCLIFENIDNTYFHCATIEFLNNKKPELKDFKIEKNLIVNFSDNFLSVKSNNKNYNPLYNAFLKAQYIFINYLQNKFNQILKKEYTIKF